MLAADIYTAEPSLKDGGRHGLLTKSGSHSNSCPVMEFDTRNKQNDLLKCQSRWSESKVFLQYVSIVAPFDLDNNLLQNNWQIEMYLYTG